jgi:hypothetical protein
MYNSILPRTNDEKRVLAMYACNEMVFMAEPVQRTKPLSRGRVHTSRCPTMIDFDPSMCPLHMHMGVDIVDSPFRNPLP